MPVCKPCEHGPQISHCKICRRKYYEEYKNRPGVKEYQKEATRRIRIIPRLIKYYMKELNKTNAQIKRTWKVPPIALEGKQIQLQNIIDNLKIIREHTKKLPLEMRDKARDKMINKLLSTEGKLVSFRKPLS